MKIANEFTVNAPIERAWEVLSDLEQVIPLMPGARLISQDGDDFVGAVKVKVGPVTSEFTGKAQFLERDQEQHRAVISGRGKESRGSGNATATVATQLHEDGERTRVTVETDLKVVGKLAQFGSGTLQQVSEKLLDQFVESLEAKLTGADTAIAPAAGTANTTAATTTASEPAPIDLLELTGVGSLKKYGPVLLGALAVLVLLWVLRRRR
ncbi:MAG TPA: SRPBCC family protein [Mycobacterium sp.]|nr:SRPBCC family protein [Mycobacterium sp.]